MAAYAKSVRIHTQVKIRLRVPNRTLLVDHMAGITPHIERGMTAPRIGNAHAIEMALETKVIFRVTCERFPQVILIRRIMRVMACGAIPGHWGMQQPLSRTRLLVCMALQAKRQSRGCNEVYASNVASYTHLMAGITSAFYGRVYRFFSGFVLVALEALCRIHIFRKGNRVFAGEKTRSATNHKQNRNR